MNQRGSSMVMALLALFFTASMVALLLERGDGLRNATKADRTEIRAHYAAEGGLERARYELARDAKWSGAQFDLNGIRVEVRIEDNTIVAIASPGSVRLEAAR